MPIAPTIHAILQQNLSLYYFLCQLVSYGPCVFADNSGGYLSASYAGGHPGIRDGVAQTIQQGSGNGVVASYIFTFLPGSLLGELLL